VRLPDGLRDRIARSAKLNGRSMNSEIVAVLLANYPDEGDVSEVVAYSKLIIDELTDDPKHVPIRELKERLKKMVELLGHS
jgi:hypothetical protein